MAKLSKRQKKLFRKLVSTAYERELKGHLERLSGEFERWKKGEISSGELSDLIHAYHNGPSREMWSHYNAVDPYVIVIQSVAKGFLSPEEVPEELREDVPAGAETMKELWAE